MSKDLGTVNGVGALPAGEQDLGHLGPWFTTFSPVSSRCAGSLPPRLLLRAGSPVSSAESCKYLISTRTVSPRLDDPRTEQTFVTGWPPSCPQCPLLGAS